MSNVPFHDEISLAKQAAVLAQQAMELRLIPSFAIHYFPDTWQFYLPNFTSEPLAPERAYLQLKRMLASSASDR